MDLDWATIFYPKIEDGIQRKKFDILPRVLPWAGDFQENVDLTVEWLVRDGKRDEVRLARAPVINVVRNGWYTIEAEDGQYLHCCYPQDMLKFRGQYEALRGQIMGTDVENLSNVTQTAESARTLLWSAWHCLGGDGRRVEPTDNPTDKLGMPMIQPLTPSGEWPRKWTYQCFKCCEDLPKNLKLMQKMQHSKIANMQ